ncbi:hypothetical protein CK203_051825 [Vitis vinifera]|uniref:Integrase catalytic domain-containing protein n=1 Tax=Vitis vinifera TaxID=29760 RepID=A0A438GUP0_VITVI|nr:hypothetical protein CK203_051825 [Vitis vinifera]
MADQPRELRIRSDLSTDERDSLIQLLRSYLDVFAWSYEDMPGLDPSIVQHRLPLLPHARPVKQKLRRLHPRWSLQVKEEIQKQVSVGFLSVVEYLEWLANVVPVPKKDDKYDRSFDVVLYGRIFRYSQILMAPEDMEKTSFITEWDDMIVKSRDRSDHLAALERFFERIRQFRLRLNPRKCTFGSDFWETLGYMVSERGIEVDPDKIRAILDMPALRTEREVRGFLNRLYASVPSRGSESTCCHLLFWRLLHQAVLYSYTFRIRRGLGCMLAQLDDSGKDRAIYYLSKRMLDYETRPALVGRLMRWLVLLTEFDIHYVTQKSIRGSIVADHLASLPVSDARAIDDDFPDEDVVAVTSLSGWRISFGILDRHLATNNIVEYEACILGLETTLELGLDRWRYTHLPRAQNQFVDDLATLASMIDIPVDATVRPLLIESRFAPAYCCLIDDVEPDDGLPWRSPDGMLLLCLDHASADRVMREIAASCSEVSRVSDTRRSHSRAALRAARIDFTMAISIWGIDIIGKISSKSSSGHEFILVAIDYFTKWVETASYARLTSAGVASFIKSHIICRYGVPHELISDRGVHSEQRLTP